jgi:peroxiredoxin
MIESKLKIGDDAGGGIVYRINKEGIHESQDVLALFKDKRVVVFGGPAPFSRLDTQQAKEYAESSIELIELGLDNVYGIYCQDAFVMAEFDKRIKETYPTHKINFYADGDAFFMRAHQLEHNFTYQGLSVRSQRFAMVVKDCKIEYIVVDEYSVIEDTASTKIIEWLKSQ